MGRPRKNSGKKVEKVPTQFDVSQELEDLAKTLIPKYHDSLINAKIAYLFINKPMTKGGQNVIATAEKCSKKVKVLCDKDFIITAAYPTWRELSDIQKTAVMDHELTHCMVDDDEETGEMKTKIVNHDFSDFLQILEKYGLFKEDLVALGRVVQHKLDEGTAPALIVKKKEELVVDKEEIEDDEDEENDDDEEEGENDLDDLVEN